MKSLLLIGIGNLGSNLLQLLAFNPRYQVTVAARNEDELCRRINMINQSLLQLMIPNRIRMVQLDLFNVNDTSDKIARLKPDIIFTAVSLQSWWVISELPPDIFSELDEARVGPWLPMHLTLIYKLMIAIKQTGLSPKVVNGSYPDVVNPLLAKVGLGPYVGIGNVANPVPGIRFCIAQHLKCAPEEISVKFFAHHTVSYRVSRKGTAEGLPYHLSIFHQGTDITSDVPKNKPFELLPTLFRRLGGKEGQLMTASSALSVLNALASENLTPVHAPGPFGWEGGFALQLSQDEMKVDLPPGLTLEEAIALNRAGAILDGIEAIEPDGTIRFNPVNMRIMKKILGYSIQSFHVSESEQHADMLKRLYKNFALASVHL